MWIKITVFEVVTPIAGPEDLYKETENRTENNPKAGQENIGEQTENQVDNKNRTDGVSTENRTENQQKSDRKSDRKIFIRRKKIVDLMRIHPSISQNKMASHLRIARSTLANDIKHLQECGIIFRVGPDKGGHWEVIIDNNDSK